MLVSLTPGKAGAIVLSISTLLLALGPGLSQEIRLQSVTEIDCSAYQRREDGSWIALRANKILKHGKVAREVIQSDDLEAAKLTDGSSLYRLLDTLCARLKK